MTQMVGISNVVPVGSSSASRYGALAAPPQAAIPALDKLAAEGVDRSQVGWNAVVVSIAVEHLSQRPWTGIGWCRRRRRASRIARSLRPCVCWSYAALGGSFLLGSPHICE
jgi:hypothetical protein